MRFFALFAAALGFASALSPVAAVAQTPTSPAPAVGSTLTLADAVAIGKRSNPGFQTALNSRRTASNNARMANGQFLPSINSIFGGSYRQGGQVLFNGVPQGATNDILGTSGSVSASVSFGMDMLSDRKASLVERDIAEADIGNAELSLRQRITNQYIAVLAAQATANLQDTLLVTTAAQLELAKAKLQVGTGIQLDVENAEVANGTQRVAVLRTRNQVDIEKVRLFQEMGVAPVLSAQLQPLTAIDLPQFTLPDLLQMAAKSNPTLESNRARERQAEYTLTSRRRQYLPSVSLSTNVGGNAQRSTDTDLLIAQAKANVPNQIASCVRSEEVRFKLNLDNRFAECNSISFTPADEAQIRDQQSKFPFGLQRQPYGFSVGLSLPIFNGFQREAGVQNATIQRKNAQNTLRQEELRLNADITAAWLNLNTSQQTVALQEQNARTARSALTLAEGRYRVGNINLVELIQARSAFDRAETDRINAIYDFQRAFVQLEAAVGRPLR